MAKPKQTLARWALLLRERWRFRRCGGVSWDVRRNLQPRADLLSARGAPMVRPGLSVPTLDRHPAISRGRVPEIGNCRGNFRWSPNLCSARDEIQVAERGRIQVPSAILPSWVRAARDANRFCDRPGLAASWSGPAVVAAIRRRDRYSTAIGSAVPTQDLAGDHAPHLSAAKFARHNSRGGSDRAAWELDSSFQPTIPGGDRHSGCCCHCCRCP